MTYSSPALTSASTASGRTGSPPRRRAPGISVSIGAMTNRNLFAPAGTMISLNTSLSTSANGCSRPTGRPDAVRTDADAASSQSAAVAASGRRRERSAAARSAAMNARFTRSHRPRAPVGRQLRLAAVATVGISRPSPRPGAEHRGPSVASTGAPACAPQLVGQPVVKRGAQRSPAPRSAAPLTRSVGEPEARRQLARSSGLRRPASPRSSAAAAERRTSGSAK